MVEYGIVGWWTIVHTLSGIIMGFIANSWVFKKVKPYLACIIVFILVVIWEFFEHYITVPLVGFGIESMKNRISDVVVGFGAFLVTYFTLRKKGISF